MSTPDPRLQLRPEVVTEPTSQPTEAFMHETLRPILKLQNAHFLLITRHFLAKRKVRLDTLSAAQRLQQISHSIARDNRLRGLLFGCVLGQFTETELAFYLDNESEVNRRITHLLVERIQTQIEALLLPV
jgi:hypothetical protein